MLTDDDLLRYSRHILLNDIGIEGQTRIQEARALVIGAGGLGSPVALYLGSAGIGRLTIVDHDSVDLTNLQRQIAHTQARVGLPKVDSIQSAVNQLNPQVEVVAPLVGMVGSMQAAEALKLVTGAGRPLTGRLLLIDGRAMEFTEVKLARNPACPVCAAQR